MVFKEMKSELFVQKIMVKNERLLHAYLLIYMINNQNINAL